MPTEQSDVWSFGIVMWELCTMGGLPYGHVKIVDLVSHLKVDRLPMTKNMPTELYALMSSSWQAESTSRPSAKQIIDQLNQSYIADIMKTPKVKKLRNFPCILYKRSTKYTFPNLNGSLK